MSADRAVTLNLNLPSASSFETAVDIGQQDTPEQRNADQLAGDAQRMRALMSTGAESSPKSTIAPARYTSRPFDLFGGPAAAALASSVSVPPAVAAATLAPAPDIAGAGDALSQLASRLLVSDDNHGRHAVQIKLSDEGLAGVVLDVFEDEGRVVAQFVCALELARERLAAAAGWLAASLASRIGRDVLVRVLADDPEDPCPVESAASPGRPGNAAAPALPLGLLQRS